MQTLSATLAAALEAGTPQRCLIVFEDDEGTVTEEFSNEDIVVDRGIQMTALFNSETEVTVGLCPSVQLQFTMLNDHRQMADFEFGTFRAYIGARIDSGTPGQDAVTRTYTERGVQRLYEFLPLGVFDTDRPDVVSTNIIDVTALDRMSLFDKEIEAADKTALKALDTLEDMVEGLCDLIGVPYSEKPFLNSDLSVSLTDNQLSGRTYKDVLRWCAEAAGSIAIFNRDGELELRWFGTSASAEYDEHDYEGFAASWYETEAIDGLKIRNAGNTSETEVLPDDVEESTNPYVISGNPFL